MSDQEQSGNASCLNSEFKFFLSNENVINLRKKRKLRKKKKRTKRNIKKQKNKNKLNNRIQTSWPGKIPVLFRNSGQTSSISNGFEATRRVLGFDRDFSEKPKNI